MARIHQRSWKTVGVRGGVAPFQVNLVASKVSELQPEITIHLDAALRTRIYLYHPATDSFGIKLLVPRTIQGIGEVDAPAITADLHHLRPAIQWRARVFRVRRLAHDSTEVDRPGQLGFEGVGDVVLPKFAAAEAGDI